MRKKKKVTLLKSGNRLVVSPTTSTIYEILAPALTYVEKEFLRGYQLKIAKANDEPTIVFTDVECFGEDHRGRLSCPIGLWKLIWDALKTAGYEVCMKDLKPRDQKAFKPYWDRLKPFNLRHGQARFLVKLLANRCGRFDCPPGYGKSFLIGLVATLLPHAQIDVVTKRVAVARDRIYPELCGMLPSVGIVGGGKNVAGRRVQIYTAASFHRSPGEADILIGDECHELASDELARKLGHSDESRNFGFSASHDMRLDNKDLRLVGIFGPIIYKMSYDEAMQHGMIVPIQIIWRSVIMDYDPCEGEVDVEKKRLGIWTNDFRNDKIAEDANSYSDNTQVLITCETIEHAVNLKHRLPHFYLVHKEDGMSLKDRKRYIKQGLLEPHEPIMDTHRRAKLTRAFEAGKLKKAICTTVWNVGVSFDNLQVLIRADAGGSPINDTQIPGRVSRLGQDKEVGIVHDYMDQFSKSFRSKARGREKNYEGHGWDQSFPDKPKKGSLAEQLYLDYMD